MLSKIMGLVLAWLLYGLGTQIYQVVYPTLCEGDPCLEPLFPEEERVDLYVYTSPREKWQRKSLTSLWNATNISLIDGLEESLPVPLPPGTRNNGSLFLHAICARAGTPVSAVMSNAGTAARHPKYDRAYPLDNVLYASGRLTRHMKKIAKNHSMLVNSANDTRADRKGNVQFDILGFRTSTNLIPLLSWVGLVFSGGACVAPVLPVALARHAALLLGGYGVKSAMDTARAKGKAELAAIIEEEEDPAITHWYPARGIRLVYDYNRYPPTGAPMLHIVWNAQKQNFYERGYDIRYKGNKTFYVPPFYIDDFSVQRKQLVPLSTNASASDPPVLLAFKPTSKPHYQLLKQIEESFHMYFNMGLSEQDVDDVKEFFTGRLYIIAITYVISLLHVVFDFLAFKNDIGFFKSRKDFTGLSTRSIFSSFVCNVIIFLYLVDSDYTSRIVITSVGFGTLVELWKLKRVWKVAVQWHYGLPWAVFPEADTKSDGEQATDDIDARGLYYLKCAMYPMVFLWAAYSLMYYPHKSWWSWLVGSLAKGVYTFGFVSMTPQLFVNYKLKSVAHLPWRALMYKTFNTFIDDCFSWVMMMPMAHRIACLRDDVVFFCYLYQRWIYPIDKKRINEFGRAYEGSDEDNPADDPPQGQANIASHANVADDKRKSE